MRAAWSAVEDEAPLRQRYGSDLGEQQGDVGSLAEHRAKWLGDVGSMPGCRHG